MAYEGYADQNEASLDYVGNTTRKGPTGQEAVAALGAQDPQGANIDLRALALQSQATAALEPRAPARRLDPDAEQRGAQLASRTPTRNVLLTPPGPMVG